MKDQTCCFTGHRLIPKHHMAAVRVGTEMKIRELIQKKGVRYFGVGGARGYDSLAADILLRLRDTDFPHIRVILIYPFEGFTNRWSAAEQAAYAATLHRYDKRVCVAPEGSKEAYKARDRHMVDNSHYVIAYCTRDYSGTGYTIRYARSKGLEIFNVAEEEGLRA